MATEKSRYFRVIETKNGVPETYGSYYITDDTSTVETVTEDHFFGYPDTYVANDGVGFICEELTKRQYQAGIAYNKYFGPDMSSSSRKMLEDNMFPTKDMAQMFARANSIVRIGYPNMHNVHKMNENRELSFVYHYDAKRLGILPNYRRAYPV